MDPASRSRALRFAGAVILTAAVGFVLIAVSNATAVDIAGIVLVGAALVLAVAGVFYEIGASEDRERAEAEAARRRRGDGPA